jgi:hypothetical protein
VVALGTPSSQHPVVFLVRDRGLVEGQALRRGDLVLRRVVERVLQKHDGACRLLLVTDQLEELYTLCREPNLRQRFLKEVLSGGATAGDRREMIAHLFHPR